jgi:hypothetical protein
MILTIIFLNIICENNFKNVLWKENIYFIICLVVGLLDNFLSLIIYFFSSIMYKLSNHYFLCFFIQNCFSYHEKF